MKELNDGGPAFPLRGFDETMGTCPKNGMSLRDFFAAHMMASTMLACQTNDDMSVADYAEEAYRFADAMLKAREVKP